MARRPKPPLVLTRRGEHALVLLIATLFLIAMGLAGSIELGIIW